jgi:hypothetical protein
VAWDGVDAVETFGVDVRMVFVLFASGVVLDVVEVVVEVICVSNAVFVIAAVPDFS